MDFQAANDISVIVEKGKVIIPAYGGIKIETYHTPHFTTNILSVGQLSNIFSIIFIVYTLAVDLISNCFLMCRNSTKIMSSIQIGNDGLYNFEGSNRDLQTASDSKEASCSFCRTSASQIEMNFAMQWHRTTGHRSKCKYMKLS